MKIRVGFIKTTHRLFPLLYEPQITYYKNVKLYKPLKNKIKFSE